MLVLSRKKDESIVCGYDNNIIVTVIEIRGDKVRLGVDAPKEVPVHRREVFDAIRENNGGTYKKPQKQLEYEQFQTYIGNGEFLEAGELYTQIDSYVQPSETTRLITGLVGRLKG